MNEDRGSSNKQQVKKVYHQGSFKKHDDHRHAPMPETVANEKPTRNSLAAYMVKPPGIHFETQDKQEKIVLLLRRHVVTNLRWVLITFFLLMAPLLASFYPVFRVLPAGFQITLIVLWYLFVTAYVFEHFLSWYFNVYIITDERIVDVDFHSLMYKVISQAKIDNIQDVTFVMGGLSQSLFNFGTVFIQTAGEKREFDFDDVPHPDKVAKVLNELIIEEEKEKLEGRVR